MQTFCLFLAATNNYRGFPEKRPYIIYDRRDRIRLRERIRHWGERQWQRG
jgi:hypothetical protein